jgi:hypothetical protein
MSDAHDREMREEVAFAGLELVSSLCAALPPASDLSGVRADAMALFLELVRLELRACRS